MEQRLNRVILTYLFVSRVDFLDYFDAAMLPRCRIVLLLKYVSLVAVPPLLTEWVVVQRILSCIQIQSRGSDATSAVPAAFYRRASRGLRSCIHFVRSAICRLVLRCSVRRVKLADIFLAAIPHRKRCKSVHLDQHRAPDS
jgi:hypothetical protein